MTDTEITTATVEPEPSLTLSQVSQLLREGAAYERAQRPIVLHTQPSVNFAEGSPGTLAGNLPGSVAAQVPATFTATSAPPQHPGISINYPSAAELAYVVPSAPLRHPVSVRVWGSTLAYLGVGALLAGAADGIVAGDSALSVGGCVTGIVAIIAGLIRAQFEEVN